MENIYGVLNDWTIADESLQSDSEHKKKKTIDEELKTLSDRSLIKTKPTMITSAGWYRVITLTTKGTVLNGLLMISHTYQYTEPESILVICNIGHNQGHFNLIKHFQENKNGSLPLIDKIRIMYSTTAQNNNPSYIDIHYAENTQNMMYTTSIFSGGYSKIIYDSTLKSVEESLEGYTSIEYDLTQKDIFERLDALENK